MKHESTVNIRYCETDATGHVNHISFFIYLEEARLHFFESLGIQIAGGNLHLILVSTKCDYKGQAYYGQSLDVLTNISKIGTKSFTIQHDVLDSETKKPIASGEASIVNFNYETQKSEEIPSFLREQLKQYMEE
ncbi:thioesterase family protein [Bacillus sp. JJ1533]|uniref:acyl-CoA thioesterase n=1 Tax=Bacillus sp. JJ1533 TaxID=3122959 RepID=UPI002FFE59B2